MLSKELESAFRNAEWTMHTGSSAYFRHIRKIEKLICEKNYAHRYYENYETGEQTKSENRAETWMQQGDHVVVHDLYEKYKIN